MTAKLPILLAIFILSSGPVALADAGTKAEIARVPGTKFRDCAHCPEMIVVPPGSFNLALPTQAYADLLHLKIEDHAIRVDIRKSFAVGIFDVTRDEYAVFVRETGRTGGEGCQRLDAESRWITDIDLTWRHPGFPQTGRDPVVCVNWDDARAYVKWLNGKVQKERPRADGSDDGPYRLPSGEEWEYVARGGTENATDYYWGYYPPSHDEANYGLDPCCGVSKQGKDRWYFTSPVGSFAPNVFGLYDTFGNVYQWTDDCYRESSLGAPRDGSAWTSDMCGIRYLRGGAYDDEGDSLGIAGPGNPFATHVRNNANGFRVVRSLDR